MLINTVLVSGLYPTGPPPWPACRVATPFSMLLCTVATWTWCSGLYKNTSQHPLSPRFAVALLTSYHSYILPSLIIVTLFGVAALKHRQALVHLHSPAAQPVLHHSHGNSVTSTRRQLDHSTLSLWWDIDWLSTLSKPSVVSTICTNRVSSLNVAADTYSHRTRQASKGNACGEDTHKGLWYASGPAEQATGGLLACLLEDVCTADAQTADQPRTNFHQGLLQLLILYLLFQTP